MKDKFALLAGIAIAITIAGNLFACFYNESHKTYSEIPEHEKEIIAMIKDDDWHRCDICDEQYFGFELFKWNNKLICHNCLNEYYEIFYYEDLQ